MIPESFIVHCSSFGNRLYGSLLKNKKWIIYSNQWFLWFVKNREIFRYFFFQSSAINFKSDVVEAAYVSTAASTKMKPYHLFLKPAK